MATIQTFSQLTAPATTPIKNCGESVNHTFQITVASIDTNVVLTLKGTPNGASLGVLVPEGVVSGAAISSGQITITANGTYIFKVSNQPLSGVALTFVSEAGGTAATIDSVYMGE